MIRIRERVEYDKDEYYPRLIDNVSEEIELD